MGNLHDAKELRLARVAERRRAGKPEKVGSVGLRRAFRSEILTEALQSMAVRRNVQRNLEDVALRSQGRDFEARTILTLQNNTFEQATSDGITGLMEITVPPVTAEVISITDKRGTNPGHTGNQHVSAA